MSARLLALSAATALSIGCAEEARAPALATGAAASGEVLISSSTGLTAHPACPAREVAEEHCPSHRAVSPRHQQALSDLIRSCEQWLEQAPLDYFYIQQRTYGDASALPITVQVCGGAVERTMVGGQDVSADIGTMVDLYWELAEYIERDAAESIDIADSPAHPEAPYPAEAQLLLDEPLRIRTTWIRPQ